MDRQRVMIVRNVLMVLPIGAILAALAGLARYVDAHPGEAVNASVQLGRLLT